MMQAGTNMSNEQQRQQSQPPWPPMQPQSQPQPQPQPYWPPMQPQFTPQPDIQPQYAVPARPVVPPSVSVAVPPVEPTDEVRTLWVGDLQFWMDESYLYSCFVHTGEVASVKVIRNKLTSASEGYGFVEFYTHAMAERALQMYNGTLMPQTEQCFRLNWAAFGMGERRTEGIDLSIFVGDLAPDVNDSLLEETFKSRYPSVKSAKVVLDLLTGRSKGYGFVRFGEDSERTHAMSEMNGVYCSSRPMRISVATSKKSLGATQQYNPKGFKCT